jgi:hypothetical protein
MSSSPFNPTGPTQDERLRIEALRQAVTVVNQVEENVVECAEAFYAFLANSPAGEDK